MRGIEAACGEELCDKEEAGAGQELRQVYRERKRDYVVLQDQSFQPAGDPEATLASVQALCKLLGGGEQILLYQTWAYKDHSEKLAGTGMDYDAMRDKLRDTYEKAAQMTGGIRMSCLLRRTWMRLRQRSCGTLPGKPRSGRTVRDRGRWSKCQKRRLVAAAELYEKGSSAGRCLNGNRNGSRPRSDKTIWRRNVEIGIDGASSHAPTV